MIRLPKRTASADSAEQLDDDDLLLEVDEPGESEQTHQLLAVDAEAAAIAVGSPPPRAAAVPDAVPVGQVMASLEAEMSRALSDDKAAWVPRTRSSAPPPSASALPAIPSAPRLPDFGADLRPAPRAVAAEAHEAAPVAAAAPAVPASAAEAIASPPAGEPPPAPIPQIVVVREKPAFAWIIACLALGALGAVVGMRVASGLSRDGLGAPATPTPVVTAQVTPSPPGAATPVTPSAPGAATPVAPSAPAAAVVSFDERDAVRVGRPRPAAPLSAAEVLGLSPSPSPPSAPPSAKPSAEGPPPLVPDPPRVAPPPPPPKPGRPKTPQEQLLEAQLKASER